MSRAHSFLAQQAEKFLHDDSLDSSRSSIDLHRSLSPGHRSKSSRRRANKKTDHTKDTLKLNQSTLSRRSPLNKASGFDSKLDLSRNKSLGRKWTINTSRPDMFAYPASCQQEKYLLRTRVNDLEKTIDDQNKKVKKLYKRVLGKREEVKDLTDQLLDSKKKNLLVLDLKEKIKILENNELSLVQELNEQQKVTKNTLNRLYELQEEWTMETERSKRHYQEQCNKRMDEHQNMWEDKIRKLEEENLRLVSKVREMENMEEIERKRRNIAVSNEVTVLKSNLNDQMLENDRLRNQIRELKESMAESERLATMEIRSLQNSIEILSDQNRAYRSNEEGMTSRDLHEKNQLKRKVSALQEELEQKDQIIKEKDLNYKEQLEAISRKVAGLQQELKKLNQYEEKVDELQKSLAIKENELELTKKYYKEKLEARKTSQEQQKKEWSSIYNELLSEIKLLKGEIDNLGGESKKLVSSLKLR